MDVSRYVAAPCTTLGVDVADWRTMTGIDPTAGVPFIDATGRGCRWTSSAGAVLSLWWNTAHADGLNDHTYVHLRLTGFQHLTMGAMNPSMLLSTFLFQLTGK